MRLFLFFACFLWLLAPPLPAADERVATITPDQLQDFDAYPPVVKDLVNRALVLTLMKLNYTYGSANPSNGGMDCSGTINHLLQSAGVKNVPRQANTLYSWVWKSSRFHAVVSPNFSSFEFQNLKPGDLLFWSGTYAVDRDPPVTHVMMYLGKLKSDKRPVMFGASSGRQYAGKPRNGVSVFDFVIPKSGSEARFLGYASIPGLENRIDLPPAKVAIPAMTDTKPPEKPEPAVIPPMEIPAPVVPPEDKEKAEEAQPPRAVPVEPSATPE